MHSYYKLPPGLAADIDTFARGVQQLAAGEITPDAFKPQRVTRGIYEQRRDNTFLLRVRVAGGALTRPQALELARLCREFGNGTLHITTRQNIQFHDVALADTPAMMRRLLSAGLTSRGGGGNTVRNVMACPYAGTCPSECFDVTPCMHAVTEYLISQAGSFALPRKFKVAFSGCAADCALAQINDLGFIAAYRGDQPGFRVFAGGGMGAMSRLADLLLDWTPATEILRVAETVRRLFDRHGDRTNRSRARLRYVLQRLGAAEFRRLFDEELSHVIADGIPAWDATTLGHRGHRVEKSTQSSSVPSPPLSALGDPNPHPPTPELRAGIRVLPQRQPGVFTVLLHIPLGLLPADDLARIAELAAQFSPEPGIRTTRSQNLLLRSVPEAELPALAAALRGLQTDVLAPVPLDRFVTCAGAATCRMGLCRTRDAATACAAALAEARISRDTLDALAFQFNGCANACGQHPVGAIGFFGGTRKAEEKTIPAYSVTLGGRCDAEGARLGTPMGKLPAAALPAFVRELALDFQSRRSPGETFAAWFDRTGLAHFQALVARHAAVPAFAERPDYFADLGATAPLAGKS